MEEGGWAKCFSFFYPVNYQKSTRMLSSKVHEDKCCNKGTDNAQIYHQQSGRGGRDLQLSVVSMDSTVSVKFKNS